jgi:ATP-binding cassette subfamily B multidrug efflux pump
LVDNQQQLFAALHRLPNKANPCNKEPGRHRIMFALLRPTDPPKHPEPPAGLVAFFWHFARQAKWLFVALFVVESFVALTDSAVPWFMGRIVTLVTTVPPDRFLAATWPMPC